MIRLLPQLWRFLVVGLCCTLLQYAVLAAGVEWLGIAPLPASSAGFIASAALNYLLNRRYTWASAQPHQRAVPRFLLVLVAGLLLNGLFMQLLHGYLHWHYLVAQVLATAVTTLWNFTAHHWWTFTSGGRLTGRSS